MLKIIEATTGSDYDAVRQLCWEYRDHLLGLSPEDEVIVRMFYPRDAYLTIMENLPQEHAPPNGCVKLALHDGEPVGCGMIHKLMPGTAEIKRVFVRQEARGLGAGRAMMVALIDQCRADGFSRIYMDTAKALTTAQKLYFALGFKSRGPYQEVPEEAQARMAFFEMDL